MLLSHHPIQMLKRDTIEAKEEATGRAHPLRKTGAKSLQRLVIAKKKGPIE